MSKILINWLSVGAGIMLTAVSASAQTSTPAVPAASAPSTTIGVTAQEAKEATKKAVPRADTGTLVRTKPSAATMAKEAVNDGNTNTTGTPKSAQTNSGVNVPATVDANNVPAVVPGAVGSTSDMSGAKKGGDKRTSRPARADRN